MKHYRKYDTNIALCGNSGIRTVFTEYIEDITCARCKKIATEDNSELMLRLRSIDDKAKYIKNRDKC